jgi:hypothetical protein
MQCDRAKGILVVVVVGPSDSPNIVCRTGYDALDHSLLREETRRKKGDQQRIWWERQKNAARFRPRPARRPLRRGGLRIGWWLDLNGIAHCEYTPQNAGAVELEVRILRQ